MQPAQAHHSLYSVKYFSHQVPLAIVSTICKTSLSSNPQTLKADQRLWWITYVLTLANDILTGLPQHTHILFVCIVTQNWQVQDVTAISSYDTAGSFLLLRCQNGSSYYTDMEKFPLRIKDNDLLVPELYHEPAFEAVTYH